MAAKSLKRKLPCYNYRMNKNIIYIVIAVIAIVLLGFLFLRSSPTEPEVVNILSFEDCVKAGYPVIENERRQCKTPDGRTYAEETTPPFTYDRASTNLIVVEAPLPGAVTGKEFLILGEARGNWYFEASFPVTILDKNGKVLVQTYATALGEWMTENFVPFRAEIEVPQSYIGPATLILSKDNPSGLPENDASVSFPITIEY